MTENTIKFNEGHLRAFKNFSKLLEEEKIRLLYSKPYCHILVQQLIRAELNSQDIGFEEIFRGLPTSTYSRKSVYDFVCRLVERGVLTKKTSEAKKTLKAIQLSDDVKSMLISYMDNQLSAALDNGMVKG